MRLRTWAWARVAVLATVLAGVVPATAATPVAAAGAAWSALSVGAQSVCGVRVDGSLWCWGANDTGQLGDGTVSTRRTPVRVGTLSTWKQVSVGTQSACPARLDGSLWCWGQNTLGQLGIGSTVTGVLVPTAVQPGTRWSQVSAHDQTGCGVRTDASLWCWGYNAEGQTGIGSTAQVLRAPVRVGTATGWAAVAQGGSHACAVRTDGSLWCWGRNGDGELGTGSGVARQPAPVRVGTGTDWTAVDTTFRFGCGLRGAGTVSCWGVNHTGQLGDGTTTRRPVPTPIRSAAGVWTGVAVGGAGTTTCGIAPGGPARCWGANFGGMLGTGSQVSLGTVAVATPRAVAGSWRQVDLGTSHGCGIRTDGTLWCWGDPAGGALGAALTGPQYLPVQVGAATWTQVSAGADVTCGLRTGGSLWCWGSNSLGQLGDGSTSRDPRPTPVRVGTATWSRVDAGADHTCGIRTDGSLWCWGSNDAGQLGNGTMTNGATTAPVRVGTGTSWTALALGTSFSCGIRGSGAAGALFCWGPAAPASSASAPCPRPGPPRPRSARPPAGPRSRPGSGTPAGCAPAGWPAGGPG